MTDSQGEWRQPPRRPVTFAPFNAISRARCLIWVMPVNRTSKAQALGKLSLDDRPGRNIPELQGTNPSIGLIGRIAGLARTGDFGESLERELPVSRLRPYSIMDGKPLY